MESDSTLRFGFKALINSISYTKHSNLFLHFTVIVIVTIVIIIIVIINQDDFNRSYYLVFFTLFSWWRKVYTRVFATT